MPHARTPKLPRIPYLVSDCDASGWIDRPELVSRVVHRLVDVGLVVLDGQFGCGKTVLARQVLAHERSEDRITCELDLSGLASSSAMRRMQAFAKDALRGSKAPSLTVVFDNVPSFDEIDADALSSVCRKLLARRARVLIVVSPENESSLATLPRHETLLGRELLVPESDFPSWIPAFDAVQPRDAYALTRGLPLLVRAAGEALSLAHLGQPPALATSDVFCAAAATMAGALVTQAGRDELRELMLTLLAMGAGTVSDLRLLGVRADAETVMDVAVGYPFFGLDPFDATFEAPGIPLESYAEVFRPHLPCLRPRLSRTACHLAERGDFVRAVQIAGAFLTPQDNAPLVMGWPLEVADAGGLALIAPALSQADAERAVQRRHERDTPGRLVARLLTEVLGSREPPEVDPLLDLVRSTVSNRLLEGSYATHHAPAWEIGDAERDMALFEQARLLAVLRAQWDRPGAVSWKMAAPELAEDPSDEGGSTWEHVRRLEGAGFLRASSRGDARPSLDGNELVVALRVLVCASALMAEGDNANAYRLVIASGVRLDGTGVVSALLLRLFGLAARLCSDALSAREALALRRARETLYAEVLKPLGERADALDRIAEAYLRGEGLDEADHLLDIASASGDCLTHLATYLVLAIDDARNGSFRRAEVRAQHAREFALQAAAPFFARAANLVEAAAVAARGQRERAAELAAHALSSEGTGAHDPLNPLALFFSVALGDDESRTENMAWDLRESACPASCEPLLDLLSRAYVLSRGEVAPPEPEAFLPEGWARGVARWKAERERVAQRPQEPVQTTDAAGREKVRVNVLGRFEVSFGERRTVDFGRARKVGCLLAALAVSSGHALGRDDLARVAWPEVRVERARDRYYANLSNLRKQMDGEDRGPEACLQVGLGQVALNSARVVCDIDLLEDGARRISSRAVRGAEAVRVCQQLMELYRGDAFVPDTGLPDFFLARRDELRRTYVDALLAGTEEALRADMRREALWLARTASSYDGLREEASEFLMEALVLNREFAEARDAYEEYVQYVVGTLGVRPSAKMRELYARVLEEVGARRGPRPDRERERGKREARMSEQAKGWVLKRG